MIVNEKAGFIRRNFPVIVAFVIPVIILSVIFICSGVYPFGDEMYLRSDMYHQYSPFMREFQRILQEGGSLNFTWNIGLGSNFLSTYSYYLASPLNWIIALFPGTAVPAVMDSFIVLKCGLMSATFTYYLIVKFKRRSMFASMFGIFYAMSAYMAAYSWNLMWLDCLVLMPLIMLGLERLVKKKQVILYTVTLAIAVLSNYYIGIMIAIFLVIYFLYVLFFDRGDKNPVRRSGKDMFGAFIRFAVYSILAGLMSMAVVLPAICALSGTASGEFNFPQTLTIYNNMLEVLSKGTILTEPAVFSGYFPNIFCTCALFILVPLFWINKRINIVRKVGLTLLIVFFLLCFDANITTYIWHGFHFPNSLPCRQSFIYILIILLVGYEAIIRYKEYTSLQIMLVGGWGIIGNAVFYLMFKDKEFTLLSGLVTVGFIVVYALLMIFLVNKKLGIGIVTLILLAACIGESAFNTAYTGYSTASYKSYTSDNRTITSLLNSISYDGFYRVEKVKRRTKNDGTWSDYRSASIFSSETLDGITQLYDSLGMQSSMNAFSYYGHTPLVTALLGVRYELSTDEVNDPLMDLHSYLEYDEDSEMYLYENRYALGLGYAVDDFINLDIDMRTSDPFKCQNSIADAMAGVDELFYIQNSVKGVNAEAVIKKSGRGYIYIQEKIKKASVKIIRGENEIEDREFSELENPQIIDLGEVQIGDRIEIKAIDDEHDGDELNVIPAVMDISKLEDFYDEVSREQLILQEFEDDYVKGLITLDEGKMLFTTIPAEDGWTVWVDGQKAEYETLEDSFIYLKMPPGTHTVEFRFEVPGRLLGLILSILALGVFLLLLYMRRPGDNKSA